MAVNQYSSSASARRKHGVVITWTLSTWTLSTFIQAVNGNTLYFPSTSMSMPMVLYVDNLHCVDLLTGEVASVLQPFSLRSPCIGAISVYQKQTSSSSRIIITMGCTGGNVSYAINTYLTKYLSRQSSIPS